METKSVIIKKTSIKIAFRGFGWVDLTNNCGIGDEHRLVDYVNDNQFTVINQDSFLHSDKFWYNQK